MPLLEVRVLAFISFVGKYSSESQKQWFKKKNLLWKKVLSVIYILFLYLCSKLSSYDDFCAALADCSRCYILFLVLLNKHQKQQVSFFISCFLYINPLICLCIIVYKLVFSDLLLCIYQIKILNGWQHF